MTRIQFQARHRYPAGFELAAEFEAAAGVTALFGPSGGGKTTILGIIAGTLRPDQARVTLDDQTLVDTAQQIFLPPERRHIGCVFQDQRLFPHLTIENNLRYGLVRGTSRPVDFAKVVEVLELGESSRPLSKHAQRRTATTRRPRPGRPLGPKAAAAGRTAHRARRQSQRSRCRLSGVSAQRMADSDAVREPRPGRRPPLRRASRRRERRQGRRVRPDGNHPRPTLCSAANCPPRRPSI